MDRMTERAYMRKCFQGRGMVARSLDMAFFSLLGGACLYVLIRNLVFSTLLSAGLFLFFILWDRRRWHRYRQRIWQEADRSLRREAWLQQEAERIRGEGGVILYPTPDGERMIGLCLNFGQGTVLHSFGDTNNDLLATAEAYGCSVVFHPWQEGSEPSREQVVERLQRDAPKRVYALWKKLIQLPGNRYLLTGVLLLLLSIILRRALYWRILGSLCLLIGTIRRSVTLYRET